MTNSLYSLLQGGVLIGYYQNAQDVAQRFLREKHPWNQVNRGRCVQGYLKVQWKEVTMIQQEEVLETHNERRAL